MGLADVLRDALRDEIDDLGYTRQELADLSKTSASHVGQALRGERNPSPGILDAWATALDREWRVELVPKGAP